jgi:hypothetical protein
VPKRLSQWFDELELARLKEISWDYTNTPQPNNNFQFSAVYLRPFGLDGAMVSAPIQLIVRLGRAEFTKLYVSPEWADRQRVALAFADHELPLNATKDDVENMMHLAGFGPQQGYLATLNPVRGIEDHLGTLALGHVNFRVQENNQTKSWRFWCIAGISVVRGVPFVLRVPLLCERHRPFRLP